MNDNQGVGLMFETEGDTLANTFKSDYGNFSDGFRKAFHHEMISYTRRKDREFVELAKPRLSALLSGTPRQILSLIPDAENGLFSRFIFYYMNVRLECLNVFADNEEMLDQYFEQLGKQFFELYRILQASQRIRSVLSSQQQEQFNSFFCTIEKRMFPNLFPPKTAEKYISRFCVADNSSTLPTTVTASRNIVTCTFQKPLKMGLFLLFSYSVENLTINTTVFLERFCTFARIFQDYFYQNNYKQ